MKKRRVWEKPTISILGVEETKNPEMGPCLNPTHLGHYGNGELYPMTRGHGYANAMS